MQAAARAPGGALLLQLALVSQDPPLELVHVSPEHVAAAAGPAVATRPTAATPVVVPMAAIAISARIHILDLGAETPAEVATY